MLSIIGNFIQKELMDQASFAPPSQLTPNSYIHKQEQNQESIKGRQIAGMITNSTIKKKSANTLSSIRSTRSENSILIRKNGQEKTTLIQAIHA
jgi:hypothetical protein